MTQTEATAEVFWTAFQHLRKKEKDLFVGKLLSDRDFLDDFKYAVLIQERKKEVTVSFDEYVKTRKAKSK